MLRTRGPRQVRLRAIIFVSGRRRRRQKNLRALDLGALIFRNSISKALILEGPFGEPNPAAPDFGPLHWHKKTPLFRPLKIERSLKDLSNFSKDPIKTPNTK